MLFTRWCHSGGFISRLADWNRLWRMTPKGTRFAKRLSFFNWHIYIFFQLNILSTSDVPDHRTNLLHCSHRSTEKWMVAAFLGPSSGRSLPLSLPALLYVLSSSPQRKVDGLLLWLCHFSLEVEAVGRRRKSLSPAPRRFNRHHLRITVRDDGALKRGGHAEDVKR